MLFCTQLAPARQVIQVGDKISTSLVWPSARLNSDLRVEMAFSEMTPLGREVAAGPAVGADVPGAVDAGDGEHETSRRPQTTAVAAAITERAGRDPPAVGHAHPIASLFPCACPAWHRAGAPHPK
jgi:hypothetical protein